MELQPCPTARRRPVAPKPSKPFPAASPSDSSSRRPADLSCSSNNKPLRPGQCLFMAVQGCRLTALKTRQTLLQLPEAAADLSWAMADFSCSSNKSLRPCQCPFMEVPGCRAMSFYGGSRLPFDSPENCPNPSAARRGRRAMSFYGGSRLPSDSPENSPNPPAAPRGRGRPVLGHGRLFL